MNLSVKLDVLGFAVIILLNRLKNVNTILFFSFALQSISQPLGLHIVLCPMKHLLFMERFLLCFLFVLTLECL